MLKPLLQPQQIEDIVRLRFKEAPQNSPEDELYLTYVSQYLQAHNLDQNNDEHMELAMLHADTQCSEWVKADPKFYSL